LKFNYIRDIAICEQDMATNGVKNIRSSADPPVDVEVLVVWRVLYLFRSLFCHQLPTLMEVELVWNDYFWMRVQNGAYKTVATSRITNKQHKRFNGIVRRIALEVQFLWKEEQVAQSM